MSSKKKWKFKNESTRHTHTLTHIDGGLKRDELVVVVLVVVMMSPMTTLGDLCSVRLETGHIRNWFPVAVAVAAAAVVAARSYVKPSMRTLLSKNWIPLGTVRVRVWCVAGL